MRLQAWHRLAFGHRQPNVSSMRLLLPILLCISTPALADSDPWGNRYPPECSEAALAGVSITVKPVPQRVVDMACHATGRFGCFTRTGVALVRDGLSPEMLAEVVRHEKCHKVAGEWH